MYGTQLHLIAIADWRGAWSPVAVFANYDDAFAYLAGTEEALELFSPPGLVPAVSAGSYTAGYSYACGYHD